jgi:hypothetical protein
MDELAFRRTVYQIAVSLMKWHLDVSLQQSTAIDYFLFVTATAENPDSHKFVVTKRSKTFTALADKLG